MYICKIKHVHSVATTADARGKLLARPGQTGILAGGTSYIFSQKKELDTLVDLRPLQLNQIKTEEGGLCIGAMTCLTDLVFDDTVKDYADGILSRAAHRTGTTLNRNLCTLGGLLVHPYIWPELATAVLALNAQLHIYRGTEDQVAAATFYAQAPAKSLACGDIVTEISFPSQPDSRRFAFEKYASTHNEFAWLTLAVGATLEAGILRDVVIVVGAATPLPRRLPEAEACLEGKTLSKPLLLEAAACASKTMQTGRDIRCSEQYKRDLCAGMLRGILEETFSTTIGK